MRDNHIIKKSGRWIVMLIGIVFMSLPLVSAQQFFVGFSGLTQMITQIAQAFMRIILNIWFMYILTIIFYFILLYGIFAALIIKTKIFGGELNKNSKTFLVGLSGLCTLGIFGLQTTSNVNTILAQTLGPFSTFAGLVIGLGLFVMVYFGFAKDDKEKAWWLGLLVAGLGLVWVGYYTQSNTALALGWFICLVAIIVFAIFKVLGGLNLGGGRGGGGGSRGGGGSTRGPGSSGTTKGDDKKSRAEKKKEKEDKKKEEKKDAEEERKRKQEEAEAINAPVSTVSGTIYDGNTTEPIELPAGVKIVFTRK